MKTIEVDRKSNEQPKKFNLKVYWNKKLFIQVVLACIATIAAAAPGEIAF